MVKPYDVSHEKSQHLAGPYEAFVESHRGSKAYIESYRPVLSDNRNIANFSLPFKDSIHPIVCESAEGPYVWDRDGNKLIDFSGGFGPVLFGHNPPFVRDALVDMLSHNRWGLGFEHELVGRCSEKVCRMLGTERCTWVNTGTEATTLAMRLCRLKTNRPKIVIFENSYHGHFDGFLGTPTTAPDKCTPASPGIARSMVSDLVMLKYDDEESLAWIRRHAKDVAGVFCEPVQNRDPSVQPRAFLRALRAICDEQAITLVFDEVVTGFRVGSGGAQAMLGVSADLACYGKAIGGGFPVGLVTGRADWMKGVDGGLWQYGDTSFPKAARTYFAGTFCKHPLAMACVNAVLDHILEHGDKLYDELNGNAKYLCDSINKFWSDKKIGFSMVHFGSQMRFIIPANIAMAFFQTLLCNGVYCWEGRTCFITTTHTREVIDDMLLALKKTTEALIEHHATLPYVAS
ncbi:hypothetical protein AB1Y20_009904 [Prymnesium parvum]|uniref:Glutamate-1-semialdehyde 2,1-aminomutase n=1 Tax=Prymnesium parvum TaxID=97485 RepID=A0AB34K2X0_PRYPA